MASLNLKGENIKSELVISFIDTLKFNPMLSYLHIDKKFYILFQEVLTFARNTQDRLQRVLEMLFDEDASHFLARGFRMKVRNYGFDVEEKIKLITMCIRYHFKKRDLLHIMIHGTEHFT